ncbi:hypothetical protein REK76_18175 [Nocardia farcinica]|uniref:hypothetical protein n=1 Tax=Nocardia farcinica TaxID=37329 RepID=UPI0031204896
MSTPTSLDGLDFAFHDLPDLHATLADLRRRAPWATVPFAGSRGILLLTHDLVAAAFKDEVTFPAAVTYRLTTGPVLGHTLQCMQGREHRIARGIATPPLRRAKVAALVEPLLEPLAHELIDDFADRGTADLVAEFTTRYRSADCSACRMPTRRPCTAGRAICSTFRSTPTPHGAPPANSPPTSRRSWPSADAPRATT